MTLPTGAITRYDYNKDGLLEQESRFDYYNGLTVVNINEYDKGRIVSTRDYKGNKSYATYDEYGYPKTATDREGNVTKYHYNAAGQLKMVVNAKGYSKSYNYNKIGLLTEETDSKGTISYMYDKEGKKKQQKDQRGNVTTYDYTLKGQLKLTKYADGTNEQITYYPNDQIKTSMDRNNAITSYTYDKAGNVETVISPTTGKTSYTYDTLNRKKTETNDKGATISYEYDAVGNVTKIVAPNRYVTTQVYDKLNNLISVTNGCMETTEYQYNKWGLKEWEIDGNGNKTSYTYDQLGNIETVTNALGEVTKYTYDKENRVLDTTNAMGYTSSVRYDALGNVETTIDAEGRTTKTLYDERGNVKYQYDGNNQLVASMTYDAASNLETMTDALGHTTTNTYTNMNQLKTSINALGQQKTRSYDNRGNLNQVVDPPTPDRAQAVVTKAMYNANGQVTSITDPEGNVQSYQYDTLGNLKYAHTPFGGTYSYTYNDLQLLETETNARGQSATYTYDAAGRVSSMSDAVDTTQYRYDKNGNLLKVISAKAGTISRTFDALNRVKTYTDAKGNTISYDYDHAGNLTKLTYPNGQSISYVYDHAGLLTDVVDFKGGVTHYEYDNNGRITVITRPNGTKKVTTYDLTGKAKTVIDTNAQGEIISKFSYEYDAAGNLTTEIGLNENPALANEEIVMTYDKGNRLATYNGEAVQYDADGNMTYGPLNGKMVNFRYDARNRLIQAGDTTYLYDAENNRIGMIEEGQETDYVINPHASLSQVLQSKKGSEVTQYIYGIGLILQVTGGEYATYHYDNRGSTVAITNSNGKVTDTFTYAPYGELLDRTGKTDTPFLYNGMYGVETDDNGLYCMRSRYYNPTIKRFINQDVVQGSLDNAITLNRYAYANGNPVTYLDPFGTEAEEIPDQAKKALREQGIDPVAYSERNKRVAQITYTQEMYERDMKQYQKDKFWSDVALGAMSPFIAVNQFVVGSGEGICNLVIHPVQSTKAMWHGLWTSDPSKNIITAPMYGVVTQAGPLVRGELSAEELVDYQVNVFNTVAIAYGGAKTVDSVATNVSKLAKSPRLATIKGTVSNVKYQKASLWERLTVRKINPSELSPSPLDDISNPKIGPSPTALSKHIMYINQNGTINGPIEVQKLASGGYEIVNGHHRWLAAIKTGLDEVPIIIKNYNN